MIKAIKNEKKIVKAICKEMDIQGIISDNRLGVYYKKLPCVFITHQLTVLTGNTTKLSSKIHRKIITKFNECWVPDVPWSENLSGKLGVNKDVNIPIKHLGPLSRLEKLNIPIKHDLLVLLSGPEPQRTLLEEKILEELHYFKGSVILVRGIVDEKVPVLNLQEKHIEAHNYMATKDLERAINSSEMVLSRSGYTTIMDLAKLEKKAFFIPTPGQYEQEYLAERLDEKGIVPCCNQEHFSIGMLQKISHYKGLSHFDYTVDMGGLFSAFSKVKENSEPTSTTLST